MAETKNPDKDLALNAPNTVDHWLRDSIKNIDEQFGAGYAKAHPELLAAMLAASASDFQTCILAARLERLTEALAEGLSRPG